MSGFSDDDGSAADRAVSHGFPSTARRVHFVGVGGVGMSGVAEMMIELGYEVSGSDQITSAATARLSDLGVTVETGHDARWVEAADAVVVSAAVPDDNPELTEARRRKLPVISRGAMLARLARSRSTVAITGTHGKSTTSSMVGVALAEAGLDPGVVVGARVGAFGSNIRVGHGPYFVLEADESEPSLLELTPQIAVITNLEEEHLDHYGTFDSLRDTMVSFANRVVASGLVVLCADDPELVRLRDRIGRRVVTYGLENKTADTVGNCPVFEAAGSRCMLRYKDQGRSVSISLQVGVPGRHNLLNALAVFSVAMEIGLDPERIVTSLAQFAGVERRFHDLGVAGGVRVIDDYAHHPTEIEAVLSTARNQPHSRLVAVFQPHRYTRTARFLDAFATVLATADVVILADIFAAGEPRMPAVTAKHLTAEIRRRTGQPVHHAGSLENVVEVVVGLVQPGDIVLTLGAGSIGAVGPRLLAMMKRRAGRLGPENSEGS